MSYGVFDLHDKLNCGDIWKKYIVQRKPGTSAAKPLIATKFRSRPGVHGDKLLESYDGLFAFT